MSKNKNEIPGKKTILEWLKEALFGTTLPADDISPAAVERLVDKAVRYVDGKKSATSTDASAKSDAEEKEILTTGDKGGDKQEKERDYCERCTYAMKRNIVASLQEIRRFAEEHHLASAMVKALLFTLAEMLLNALKGKVGGAALALLLNAITYDKARADAYREGETAGRNATIKEKYFPTTDDGIPHFSSGNASHAPHDDFFTFAKGAK